ncbi:hypothetical protein [Propioniciclava soli]|uniref:restriction endonuclease subunit S n=1 Tax=Propioniciclava soli TaxID=2775081 RepID=UPI001E28F8D4|nr:hypothetical protein [Propioniciclava soli]
MKVEWVPLGEVLEIRRTPIDLAAGESYKRIGIFSWGKGMLRRDPAAFAEMGSMKYFRFPIPSLIFSNIQAWEGAVALAGDEDTDFVCSSRFYPYIPREGADVNLGYLLEFFRSEEGLALMRRASPGTQVRNKVLSRTALEAARVPLPSCLDQEHIAAHLTAVADRAAHSGARAHGSVDRVVSSWLDSLPQRLLGELVEVGPRPFRLAPEVPIDFVPMEAVDAVTGSITGAMPRTRGELPSGYRQFLPGDVIFARITPSMQNGKCAIYHGVRADVGYGSTEFHVLRPRDPRYRQWIWALLRTQWFIRRAMAAFTGTAGQQRVPASFLQQVSVPTPAPPQLEGAIRRLLEVRVRVNVANEVARWRDELAKSLLPAARNEIFSAMR